MGFVCEDHFLAIKSISLDKNSLSGSVRAIKSSSSDHIKWLSFSNAKLLSAVVVDGFSNDRKCIACRSPANLVEYEKVLKLFFIPVWQWRGKEPLMHCNNCNLFFPPSYSLPPSPVDSAVPDVLRCRFCNRPVEPEFSFCPFCGSAL